MNAIRRMNIARKNPHPSLLPEYREKEKRGLTCKPRFASCNLRDFATSRSLPDSRKHAGRLCANDQARLPGFVPARRGARG